MTSKEAIEVKTVINSLLISNPVRSNVQQLWRDYKEIEGRPVPLNLLGFTDFEQYLKSIPDTVCVYGCGPNAQVEGVVSSKSEHIKDMILKQKKSSKKRTPARKPQQYYQANKRFEAGNRTNFATVRAGASGGAALKPSPFKSLEGLLPTPRMPPNPKLAQTSQSHCYPPQEQAKPTPKPNLKFNAESTNETKYDESLNTYNMKCSFKEKEIVSPFREKYTHTGECDNSPPVMKLHQTPLDVNNIQNYSLKNYLVQEELKPVFKPNFELNIESLQGVIPKPQTPANNLQTFPDVFYPIQVEAKSISKPHFQFAAESLQPHFVPKPPTPPIPNNVTNFPDVFYPIQLEPEPISKPNFRLVAESQSSILKCDGASPPVTKLSHAPTKYGNIDFLVDDSLPFMNLSQTVPQYGNLDLSGVTGFTKFESAGTEKLDVFTDCDYSSEVPAKVQYNLKQLIQKFPEGLECSRLPTEYQKMFKKKISYVNYNYRSVIQMCSNLPRIFHYVQQNLDDYILFDKNVPIPTSVTKKPDKVEVEVVAKSHSLEELRKVNWLSSSSFVPTEVFTMENEISRFFLSDVEVGHILDVTVGEIYDLSKFWMYMTFAGLDELMKDIQSFFGTNHSVYHIPEVSLQEGLYCVSLYSGNYHRCVIVNMLKKQRDFVRVLYIDYGTVLNVGVDQVWFLPKQFGELPWQSMRARLSNIYPVRDNFPWSVGAVAEFERLVTNRVIVAKVTKIDTKDHVLEVYLADITSEENIFYLNDIFVDKGFALYTDQERKPIPVDPDCVPLVRYIHLYPTFYEIEAGLAPNTEEMQYIIEQKIPLHIYMPQYFDIYYKEDIVSIRLEHERVNQKRIEVVFPEAVEDPEFDFSFFPASIVEDIRAIYESSAPPIRSAAEALLEGDGREDKSGEVKTNKASESAKEYSSNRLRALKLISRDDNNMGICEPSSSRVTSPSNTSTKSGAYTPSPEKSPDVMPLINNFEQISLNNTLPCTSRLSTNPFLSENNSSSDSTNPFVSTNPFLSDLLSCNTTDKPSNDYLPQKINNNLKDANTSACKKQINIDRTVNVNVPGTAGSSVSAASPGHTVETREMSTSTEENPRIRTPPGFSSMNVPESAGFNMMNFPSAMPFQPNFANVCNFGPLNNPYYQRCPPVFPNNAFMGQNPMYLPFVQPNTFNNVPQQVFPHQYNFNISNLQHFFVPQNHKPRYP